MHPLKHGNRIIHKIWPLMLLTVAVNFSFVDECGVEVEGLGLELGLPVVDGPGESIPLGVSRDDEALLFGREIFFCTVEEVYTLV